ncbi:MAG: hypothetical protein ABIA04_12770 [Pseudomonadota bacterium]
MNKIKIIIVFLLSYAFINAFLLANDLSPNKAAESFFKANQAYQDGDFELAKSLYEELSNQGLQNEVILYNLGNCNYKIGDIGKAIAFYNASKFIDPRNSDNKENLRYAISLTKDKVERSYKDDIYSSIFFFYHVFSKNELLYIFISLNLIFWILFILRLKKGLTIFTSKTILVIIFMLAAIFLTSYFIKMNHFKLFDRAYIIAKSANIYSANSKNSTLLFRLHEGSEIKVKSEDQNGFIKIYLEENKKGWIESQSVLKLSDIFN